MLSWLAYGHEFLTSASGGDVLIAWENLALKRSRKAQLGNGEGRGRRESERKRKTYFAERMKEKKQNSSLC